MSLRGGHLFFPTKQSPTIRRLLTALAYGASVGYEQERLAATL
jgi:hypothetical protein